MMTSLALAAGALSAAFKLGLEFARELPGGVMALELQDVVAGGDLDQDADVPSQGHRHPDVGAGRLQDVEEGLVEAQPVVDAAVLPMLELDHQVDGGPLA